MSPAGHYRRASGAASFANHDMNRLRLPYNPCCGWLLNSGYLIKECATLTPIDLAGGHPMPREQHPRRTRRRSTADPKDLLRVIAAPRKACPLVVSRSAHHIGVQGENVRARSPNAQSHICFLHLTPQTQTLPPRRPTSPP